MRKTMLASAAVLGLAVGVPALAQDYGAPPGTDYQGPPAATNTPRIPPPHVLMREGAINPETGARPGHIPGVGESLPMSPQASNILPSDTRSVIAPSLPAPPVGDNAGTQGFLNAAMQALSRHRTGEAQEALERAETRRLDRDAARGMAPSNDPLIQRIRAAREALGMHRIADAQQQVSGAMTATGNEPGGGPNRGMNRRMSGASMASEPFRTAEPGMSGAEGPPPGYPMNPNGDSGAPQ